MIDSDYESFLSDKAFYKRVTKFQDKDSKGIARATFAGNQNFPASFIERIDEYQNFSIEIKEYNQDYFQHLRVLHKYTKAYFFESLCPINNEENLRSLFDEASEKDRHYKFITSDNRFIIKQISKYTKNTLIKTFLIPYYNYIMQSSCFISQILGVFAVRVK